MDAQPAIAVKDVSFSYGNSFVLREVNLTIDEGDFACMVGPNGGGKTTLIRLMLGLLKPDRGVIELLGQSPETARSQAGYVPQYFQFDAHFPIKVMDVVLMGRLDRHAVLGHYRRRDKEAATQALKEVELYDLRDRPFSALSGGQRQRVLIARALASEPKLFVLDEPMANIDPGVQTELSGLLRDLNRRLTIVMVTHDMGFVSTFVNRVICVNRVVWTHPIRELTGERIFDLYGGDVHMIRHDEKCSERGLPWSSS